MFFVLRHHFVPKHFYPEVRRKNPESRRKNPESRRKKAELGGILFETFFCTEQHDKNIQKIISLGILFEPRHLFWESAEINAYRQVRHFFLPRGVCRYIYIERERDHYKWPRLSSYIFVIKNNSYPIPIYGQQYIQLNGL